MLRRTLLLVITLLAFGQLAIAAPDEVKKTLLPVDSNWSGMQVHDKAHVGGRKDKDHPCSLVVKDRDDEKFAAEYTYKFNNTRAVVRIEGRINIDGIIQAKTVKVISGSPEEGIMDRTWEGQANDKQLNLSWKQQNGAVQNAEMNPDAAPTKKKKK